jgi:UDP-GlcNAc3NAcA epimerase
VAQTTARRSSVLRVASVVGARPQFIKAFPLSRALLAHDKVEEIVIHTGQHFDANMSDIFFTELGMKRPRYSLDIHGGNHGDMTGKMLAAIEEILVSEKPDAVLVYGDTNSTLAGALAAAKLQTPVIHVEAGMRSFNRRMPEEINRVVADHLSAVLLCSTKTAVENLRREGIVNNVHKVGDLMYDATLLAIPLAERHSRVLEQLNLAPGNYGIATIHRAETTDDPDMLVKVINYLRMQSRELPLVLPLHPRAKQALKSAHIDLGDNIVVIEPLGYIDMCQLMHSAKIVLTDSGGLQKEAYFHRVPCVTLRTETEWIETIEFGWNRLWTAPHYQTRREIGEYGNGNAAEEILNILERMTISSAAKT